PADTPFLPTFTLHVDGRRFLPLSARSIQRDVARFYATNGAASDLDQDTVSLMREQRIDGSLHDELLLTNHTPEPLTLELALTCAADFLDLFEVRSPNRRLTEMDCTEAWEDDQLVFMCTQDGVGSRTVIAFSVAPRRTGS